MKYISKLGVPNGMAERILEPLARPRPLEPSTPMDEARMGPVVGV
ncbi:hypothetical protein DKAM_0940 [Desulfurococcus amylolyticus 1221n]|uniref:Uncharacterized protein n=1 Tax=Desulfurococcus amylolyticus (strain DSM 18924 / JCM 16383 / VKM B-2413 / 1221n) TaxID=490899 RepID=B8D585_DESA1|nr:hypothetical protein DKAM_0940 [Desulfurococcus amylolyticus 1221n]